MDENDVVAAVCKYLKGNGYKILETCSTAQRGIDIIAKHKKHKGRLLIEAKGATSSRKGTARYGKCFTDNQVYDRVAKGFYTTVCMYCEHARDGDHVALAVPNTERFQKHLKKLEPALEQIGITVFLVEEDKSVTKFKQIK
jgi:DNA-binding sugar fermentation-stimulating protein